MNLVEVYRSYRDEGEFGDVIRAFLLQSHWFSLNLEFDPKTGDALPQSLSSFLSRITRPATAGPLQDRLWHLTEHARPAVERLFSALNESPRREQAMLPVHQVRELDANCFIKLSNRPGRNIREKLAGKPYLQAVRRYQSVDLPENRLLKAFVLRLFGLLELRRDYLGDDDPLLVKIQRWLRSEDANKIGRWNNLPPNNTLLSNREYRRVWDAWRRLQSLDDDIHRDFLQYDQRAETMRTWNHYGQVYLDGNQLFADMPLLFDYDGYQIIPWAPSIAVKRVNRRIDRSLNRERMVKGVCVDFSTTRPSFASQGDRVDSFSEPYLWQYWSSGDRSVAIELFKSDAAYLHSDAYTVSLPDLLFSDEQLEHADRAARAFALRLRDSTSSDQLIWLVPDFLNEFELETIRRNLNACFHDSEPLPRSVAAVFDQVDYSKLNKGFSVLVVDSVGGRLCATKLIAGYDSQLKKASPETKGYYWERCPPVLLKESSREEGRAAFNDGISAVDGTGTWNLERDQSKAERFDVNRLREDPRIGGFTFGIKLVQSPVEGGSRYRELRDSSESIPLWRDQIPELSMNVYKDGCFQQFALVARGTTVKPERGVPVGIPVGQTFTLPAGQTHYSFPLQQGGQNKALRFVAYLRSPAFPLKESVECRLKMSYTYGADDPYELKFFPVDSATAVFKSIKVEWRRDSGGKCDQPVELQIPDYPIRKSWLDFQRFSNDDGTDVSNLLEWVKREVQKIGDIAQFGRVSGRISKWINKGEGNVFCFIDDTFIHQSALAGTERQELPKPGETLSFYKVKSGGGKSSAVDVCVGADELKHCFLRKSLRFPVSTIWDHEHSIREPDVPEYFVRVIQKGVQNALSIMESDEMPQALKDELFFFLCCLHRDAPIDVGNRLLETVTNRTLFLQYHRNIAFAIGGAELPWQQQLLENVLRPSLGQGFITSLSLEILSVALWRSERLIDTLGHRDLMDLNAKLYDCLEFDLQKIAGDFKWIHVSTLCKHLELLLGLIRSRDSKYDAIRQVFSPDSKHSIKYVSLLNEISKVIVNRSIPIQSRISLKVEKPEHFGQTPDLLYALRMYLTGDSGANSIVIRSISNED